MGAETCPRCTAGLPRGARFCAFCGVALAGAAAKASPRDERRVITALFADLAGSTQLGERLDPEDFRDLTHGALGVMGAAIEELGGTIRGTAGDGVLGLFGAPTAHEDDAERAVVAGLRLVERMRAYGADAARRWDVPELRVRVGIETGPAVLGEVRAGSQVQYDGSGDCLNTAARLEGAADVGGVLVGPFTRRLVRDAFDWGDPRALTLKGKAEPVLASHALAHRRENRRSDSGPDAARRLIGRDEELAVAAGIVAAVRSGDSRVLWVTGLAGIGKTRFVRELRALFESSGDERATTTWLEGTCLSYAVDEPYLPIRQVLRQALGCGDSLAEVHDAVTALGGEQRGPGLAPLLGMILGLAPQGQDASRIAALSAESLQQAVVEACAELAASLATRGPVTIVLDDLHWADTASLRLVEGLTSRLGGDLPVLLVLATRPETERPAWALRRHILRDLPRRSAEVRLSALDQDHVRRLITDLVGAGTLPAELEATLLERSDGNPFYLRELLRSLQDSGAVVHEAGRWSFDPGAAVDLPDTVERVVLARIDRLRSEDRDLLNSAAVIGREFDLELLGRVAAVELSPGALANLTRLGLIEVSSGTGFRFSHPLIQETAYRSMLRRGRAELHGRAAAAIEDSVEDSSLEHAAALARHHRAAGHVAEAVRYHRLAGLAAERVVALAEAITQVDLAISAAEALDPAQARVQLPELYLLRGRWSGQTGNYLAGIDDLRLALERARVVGDEQIEMQALNELGWLSRVRGYEDAITHHQQALRIAERLDEPSSQVTALSRMALVQLNQLRLDEGLDLARRAIGIARATGQDRLLGTALDCLKLAALQLGQLDVLEDTVAEIIEVQSRAGDLHLLQWAYIEGASVPLARGDLDQARTRMAEARAINERLGADRVGRALLLEASSWIDRGAGDPSAAVVAVEEAQRTIGEHRAPEWSAWLGASLGSHLLEQGRAAEAIAVLEPALAHAQAIKSLNRALRAASHLALARQVVGDLDGARTALSRAEDVLAGITAPVGGMFLDGYRSYLAVARTRSALGDHRGARALLGALHDAARTQGWRDASAASAALLADLPGA